MAALPALIPEDCDGNSLTGRRRGGQGMARSVSALVHLKHSKSSRSLSELPSMLMQTGSMSGDSRKGAAGSAMHLDALQNISALTSAAGAQVQLVPPEPVNNPLAPKKGQGKGGMASKKKCSANTISGRWTAEEHEAFLRGLKVYGREWKKVATCIPTRTSAQIRSHAQKYFAKITKEQQQILAMTDKRRMSLPDDVQSDAAMVHSDEPLPQSYIDTANSLMQHPSEIETRVCKTLASLRERYKQLEDQLRQTKAPPTTELPVSSGEAALGPASAALALEQKSLRRAAEARYELKRRENRPEQTQSANIATASASCARVSLASMPSHGGFDSSDVIALSKLGGSLGREKIENRTRSSIKGEKCLKLVSDRLQLIEHERPARHRKQDEQLPSY